MEEEKQKKKKTPKLTCPMETTVLRKILAYLKSLEPHGIKAWRCNTMGVWDVKKGRYRSTGRYSIRGVSDILGILPDGKFLAIEVKRNKYSKISQHQVNFLKAIRERHGIAFVAWKVEHVEAVLKPYIDPPWSELKARIKGDT